jgi:hypothetical protein
MAKSAKKASKKPAKKAAKKAVKKAPKKLVKKAAKKQTKKPAQLSGKKFLIIYHAPMDAMEQTANISPEEQAEGMAQWRAWAERVGERMLDLGAPLINGKKLNSRGFTVPSSKEVAGYSLLQAEDWEEVLDLLEGHPHISGWNPDATIEVHETMFLPGM